MKRRHVIIILIVLISFLSISFVNAQDIGDNETSISIENECSSDILEINSNEQDSYQVEEDEEDNFEQHETLCQIDEVDIEPQENLGQTEEDEVFEAVAIGEVVIGPTGPPSNEVKSLTDLQRLVRNSAIVTLNNHFAYKQGDSIDGIIIERNTMIIGNNITIDGGNIARLFVINNGSTLSIFDVNFVNATTGSNGAAIYFNGSSGFINGCSFVNCHSSNGGAIYFDGTSLAINNTIFKDNKADSFGGAVYIRAYSTAILNSVFLSNTANNGGSVYWKKSEKNLTFQDYTGGSGSGTTVYGSYSVAIGMYCKVLGSYTSAIGGNNSAINCDECFVLGLYNYINGSFGSVIIGNDNNITNRSGITAIDGYIFDEGDVGIINSIFDFNVANNVGGAIYMDSDSSLLVKQSQFNNNTAKNGGAISSQDIKVNKTVFYGNRANNVGGAILPYGEANIYNSSFVKNTADFQGGAVYSRYTKKPTRVYNSIFDANGVTGFRAGNFYGGALYDTDLIESCIFKNNYAWSGGAVYQWCDHTNSRLTINNSVFINNSARGTGGAVYAHYGGNIYDSNFTNNTAGDVGGAIGGWNQIPYNCIFINNTAKNGGAVGGETARAYNNLFINNSATNAGGAIWGFNLIVKNNLIINSSSDNVGGAIATFEYLKATSTYYNNTIINSSSKKGGAAYFENHNEVYSNFDLNKIFNATADIGGAIYTNSFTTLTNNQFEKTKAKTGGVIYNILNLTLKNNTMKDSEAELGRDIYNEKNIMISYLTFADGKNIIAEYNDVILIYADLVDDMGNTITSRNVTFNINGKTYSFESIEGKSSFNYTVDFTVGDRVVNGSYEGSDIKNTVVKTALIRVNPAILFINKTAENIIYYEGDKVVYTIVVNNTGKSKAINVNIRDNLQNGLKLINTTSTKGKYVGGIWKIDELGIGEPVYLTYTCLITDYGLIQNEAIVSSDNSETNRSIAKINVKPYQPNITVEKIALNPIVTVGQQAEFEIVITNADNVTVKGLTITEDNFDGLIYDSYHESKLWKHSLVNGKNIWTLNSDLAPNEVVSLFVYFNTTKIGTFTNTIVANSTVLENKTANATVSVFYPHVDSKKVSLMPITKVGNQTVFEITIFNDGKFDIHNLFVIEDSFDGLIFDHYLQDNLWNYSFVGGKHKWILNENLVVNETIGLFVVFNTTKVGNFTNYAIVGSDEILNRTVNATVWVNETVQNPGGNNPDLDVKITPVHSVVILGNQIMFEIVVSNTGNSILNDVSILEHSFDGLIFDHFIDHTGIWEPKSLTSLGEGILAASNNDLAWKMNMPLYINETIGFFVVFNSTKTGVFTNTILGSSDKTNNKFAATNVNVVVPEYTINKIALNQTVKIGEDVYFEIIVRNTGKVNITNLTITERPGEGLKYVSYVDSQGFWIGGANLTWKLNTTLVPGEIVGFFVIFKAEKSGNLTNTIVCGNKTSNATVKVTEKLNGTNINDDSDSRNDDSDDVPAVGSPLDNYDSDDEPSSDLPSVYEGSESGSGSFSYRGSSSDNATGKGPSSYNKKSDGPSGNQYSSHDEDTSSRVDGTKNDNVKTVSAKMNLKATGNPIALLLFVLLNLLILRRKKI